MTLSVSVPKLETERLTLRAPRVEEFPAYQTLFTGPRARYMAEFDERGAWREFASEAGHWVLFGYGPWHVLRKADDALIGGISLLNQDYYPEIELGWHLYDGFEGHGYATEAAAAARDWAFDEQGMPTLVSYIDRDNAGSIAVAERLGAVPDADAQKVDPEDVVCRHSPETRH